MPEKRLEMTFKNQADGRARISIDNPREDLNDIEIKAVMDNIVAKNLFNTSGGDLVAVVGARIVTTDVQEFELI